MMKKALIVLKPLEAYFFGNDKSFEFGNTEIQLAGSYYIESSDIPNQTTLFGVLRFIGIKNIKSNFKLDEEDIKQIGKESFDFKKDTQDFGMIKKISSLYLIDEKNNLYIKTPFDHDNNVKDKYHPFDNYVPINTNVGLKKIPINYNSKLYITDSYMNVNTGEIVEKSEVFIDVERVGINRLSENDGYFKKKYKNLNDKYSFCFFAEVEENMILTERIVFLGQGKSSFKVSIRYDIEEKEIDKFLCHDVVYAKSDILIDGSTKSVIENSDFSIIKYKNYRGFITNYNSTKEIDRFIKSADKYYLIASGSIFVGMDKNLMNKICENEKLNVIGLNLLVNGGKNNES